ncbi:serine/threonine-protein kinase [Halobacterium jilantaiense]|uniref:Protein kinase domain-containing protein n=1 Tax=Halobacterium jilantaiense TaxID=355548 RepID=A0A1I0P8L1_9EURY|nr:serine/threonine-protein kinase [Halobacterium jilantaiense]SEW10390.1 Protein kinase domain-containing protein [Halobacterium jilantaiense]
MSIQRISLDLVQEEFPDHNLTDHLDSGGQKDVFVGEWRGEEIVLKTVIVDSYEASRRAKREVEAMEKINSNTLVDLKQSFPATINDHELLVMVEEFVSGQTLREHLNNNGPSVNLGFDVAETLLTVLQEFNEKSMVHRDIKPENIMITPDGETKLLDVGIVRMLNEEGLTPTARSSAPGTTKYSAPEQLNNDKEKQDTRTDIFSTGIVMAECMTGNHPFNAVDLPVQEAIHTGEWLELEGELDMPISEHLGYFLDFMLSPNMNERFNNPEQALKQLTEIRDRI